VAGLPNGPWVVAQTIPASIYTIPASSPVHHVTYVTVEDDDEDNDEWVTFAYIAGYTGLMIGWGCAVWGSGWYYPPYYGGGIYYPGFHSYGYGAGYNPWTGAYGRGAVAYGPYGGMGAGARYNPRTGTYSRGAAAWGPYGAVGAGSAYNPRTGAVGTTRQGSNVYGSWGSTAVQRGDDWAVTNRTTNRATGTTTRTTRTDNGAAVTRNTPGAGGSYVASDTVRREVQRAREKGKPVIVSMATYAASGGYFVSMEADKIVAQPGTLTGSIGVVSLRPITAGLLERAGVNTVVLSRGAHSGVFSIGQPPSDDERQALRDLIFTSYAEFKQRVCEGRDISAERLELIAGGRIWLGQEALELGLVDHLGGLPEALLKAQELADLPRDRDARLLLARDGRGELPPQPFPAGGLLELWPLLEQALKTRILAVLPWDGI